MVSFITENWAEPARPGFLSQAGWLFVQVKDVKAAFLMGCMTLHDQFCCRNLTFDDSIDCQTWQCTFEHGRTSAKSIDWIHDERLNPIGPMVLVYMLTFGVY